jgi:hypothetical protein
MEHRVRSVKRGLLHVASRLELVTVPERLERRYEPFEACQEGHKMGPPSSRSRRSYFTH